MEPSAEDVPAHDEPEPCEGDQPDGDDDQPGELKAAHARHRLDCLRGRPLKAASTTHEVSWPAFSSMPPQSPTVAFPTLNVAPRARFDKGVVGPAVVRRATW
jgi:hypothetical protein